MSAREPILVVTEQLSIPMEEFKFSYVRSSGPGGQNVNKVSSQAQLVWRVFENESLPTEIRERLTISQKGRISKAGLLRIDCDRYRDREKNRESCLTRLRNMIIAVETPPKVRKQTKTPRRMIEARLQNKQQRAVTKQTRRRPSLDD